ncbi:MAG TPA: aminoacyl-tRNA hydrolase [Gemmataceae bacterium]|jgi:PTH1 family peptidyl-tRNA hydrolase|nr:aminoacyl-tRNA hydrolase [Gemmataceae bacterium]
MKIVVGLGNPGNKYAGTRHNVGFVVVDTLAKGPGASRFQGRFQSQIAEVIEGSEKLLLLKPDTFMNLSGQAVRSAVDFYQTPLTDLLVVCDDFNLPLGKLRVRSGGTHGGHNGLRDIQQHLGTTGYSRLRIGIGSPDEGQAVNHALGRFRPSERPVIDDAIELAVQAVVVWATRGVDDCMNQYNG